MEAPTTTPNTPNAGLSSVVDTAIVGAGIGGTYAAWQLKKSPLFASTNIHLFESTDRIGGRFHSPILAGGCDPAAGVVDETLQPRGEVGGMRLRLGGPDTALLGACEELGIELGNFTLNTYYSDPALAAADDPRNPIYARGVIANKTAIADLIARNQTLTRDASGAFSGALPYFLEPHHRPWELAGLAVSGDMNAGLGAAEIENTCSTDNVCGATDCYLEQVNRLVDGEPLWRHSSYGDATREGKGPGSEWASMIGLLTGYETRPIDINQAQSTYPFGDPITKGYVRPLKGMQEMPIRFAETFAALGGIVNMNHVLKRVRTLDDGTFQLTFRKTVTSACTAVTTETMVEEVVIAKRLVLAFPSAALERVAFDTDTVENYVRALCAKILNYEMTKVFATWDTDWFKDALTSLTGNAFTVGRYLTGGVADQLFAWYPGTQQLEEPAGCSRYSLQFYITYYEKAMSSASDLEERAQACPDAVEGTDCATACGLDPANYVGNDIESGFTKLMWEPLKSLLEELFLTTVPEPLQVRMTAWNPNSLFSGQASVHWWRSGVPFYNDMFEATQPFAGLDFHIIGESVSCDAGWGNGGVMTAQIMLTSRLGVALPSFLSENDYCKLLPYIKLI